MLNDSVFIEIALRSGQISPQHIGGGQEMQRAMELFGEEKPLSTLLLEEKLAPEDVVSEIASEMSWYWVRCRICGKPNPLARLENNGILTCEGCKGVIEYEEGRISEDDLSLFLYPREDGISP